MMENTKTPSPELAFATTIANDADYSTDGSLLYQWNGHIWSPLLPEDVEKTAFLFLARHPAYQHKVSPKLAASAASAALVIAQKKPTYTSKDVILPLTDCYLLVNESGIVQIPASKEFGLSYVISAKWDILAESREFKTFIAAVLPDPEIRAYVQAYVGYTLMPDCRYQKATFWLGGGANGKSTLAEIVSALHSKITAMSLDSLDGFKLVGLIGSSLVYVDETPSRIDEQRLKALISGGLLQIDRKFREPVNLRPTAKWIICGNSLPALRDQSHGFWRRMPVIPFSRRFAEEEQDPLLAKRIIETELDGVLAWAVEGLMMCLKAGRLPTLPDSLKDAQAQGKRGTDSVLAWLDDGRVVEHESVPADVATPRGAIYRDYANWCREHGYSPVNDANFWIRLREHLGEEATERRQRRVDGRVESYSRIELAHKPETWH